ncbi:16S rRNA (adenine(1518)-N(6)/adenine(1519)-N(6))-dimethyltransferase RsmA [Salinisphaera orenii]|uniref:16S rRNA (adenine(1518)-N(6)/adenine(1519)-N(6))- dimethyltransferase RsmA n=1 Tax=Salinisphaera orenii TaxID=856731 RepID=UPI00296EE681
MRKRFGQHFLTDRAVIDQIVTAITPVNDDCMIEIGPGQGALTRALTPHLRLLDVIEIDRDLAATIESEATDKTGAVRLIGTDALRFDYAAYARQRGTRLRLVGNLAYNIGTPLLFHILATLDTITDLHFMLQKEVVDRIVADPGDPAYGRLSVGVAVRAHRTALLEVPPQAFRPKPNVTSSVVRITPFTTPANITNWRIFDALVADAFGKRRKTCRNALAQWLSGDAIAALGIEPQRRPGELTPDDYVRLANAVTSE